MCSEIFKKKEQMDLMALEKGILTCSRAGSFFKLNIKDKIYIKDKLEEKSIQFEFTIQNLKLSEQKQIEKIENLQVCLRKFSKN